MTITIDLKPEVEKRLRKEAARSGLPADTFARRVLEERFDPSMAPTWMARQVLQRTQYLERLSKRESELLQLINQGLPPAIWQEYHELVAQRRAEALTPETHGRLIELSDEIEKANARRVGYLFELAQMRGVSLEEVMKQLGIDTPDYD